MLCRRKYFFVSGKHMDTKNSDIISQHYELLKIILDFIGTVIWPVSKIISKLLDNAAISAKQYQFMNTLFRIGNSAAHGTPITKEQAFEVLDIGQVLVKDYVAWLYWGFKK
jgi:hypothetical protein